MTDQLQQQSNSGPNLFRFAIVAAVAAVFLLPTYLKHRKESSRDALLAELQADEAHAASLVKIDEEKAARLAQQQVLDEQNAVSQAVALAVGESIEEIGANVNELEAQANEWETLQAEVLDGNLGARIATDLDATRKAKHLLDLAETFQIAEAKRLRRQLDVLAIPIKAAAENPRPGYSVTPAVTSQISDIESEVARSLKGLAKVLPPLRALANASYQDSSGNGTTLREQIAALDSAEQEAQLQAEIEHMEQVRQKNQAELIALKQANEEKLAEAQRQAEIAMLTKEKARIAAEQKAKEEEEDRRLAEVEARAKKAAEDAEFQRDLPDIKRYLASLLADAQSMRGRDASLEKAPASYGYLSGAGATADNQNSLLQYINLHSRLQDRPNAEWAKDYRMVSPGLWPQIDLTIPKRGHELLRKWGERLVEEGMLSP